MARSTLCAVRVAFFVTFTFDVLNLDGAGLVYCPCLCLVVVYETFAVSHDWHVCYWLEHMADVAVRWFVRNRLRCFRFVWLVAGSSRIWVGLLTDFGHWLDRGGLG